MQYTGDVQKLIDLGYVSNYDNSYYYKTTEANTAIFIDCKNNLISFEGTYNDRSSLIKELGKDVE